MRNAVEVSGDMAATLRSARAMQRIHGAHVVRDAGKSLLGMMVRLFHGNHATPSPTHVG